MKFRRSNSQDDWQKYMRYLDSIWSQLPSGVKAFIREEWFYDGSDHRCPHDAWLEEFTIQEVGLGERFQYRNLDIRTTLLGAFHDKRLQFAYSNVTSYLVKCSISAGAQTRQGDFLWDEVRYEAGKVIHEAIFSEGAQWVIECADIQFNWTDITQH